MKKKLLILAIVAVAVMAPAFATTSISATGGTESLNISFVKNAVNLIVGIFAGGFCLLKAALDIFHAVRNSSEDQNGLKKAIGGFVLNAAILGGFMFVINYVFGKMAGTTTGSAGAGGSSGSTPAGATGASGDFYKALSGALVPFAL